MTARWVAGSMLTGESFTSAAQAQAQYAHDEWNVVGVVRYSSQGPTFLAQDPACGVSVTSPALVELIAGGIADRAVFPDWDFRTNTVSQDARDFRNLYQGGNTPVIALFPLLGHYSADGGVDPDPAVLASTPGVVDTWAEGVVFLSYVKIAAVNDHSATAHEMVHLLTGRAHDSTPGSTAWETVLNIFSQRGDLDRPVWNGRQGDAAGIVTRNWSEDLLTLVNVNYQGVDFDQCNEARGARWLQ
jgi:hypothetical protein